jgi:hypothetical protein
MCMITYLPANVKVPVSGIYNGGTWNDDGHGWAIAAEIGYMPTGHYMDLETALETFLVMREQYPASPALFHSRWATHGSKGIKNVHPFYVGGKEFGKNVVVAHNGILPTAFHPTKKDTRSDTAILAQEWLGMQTRGTWTRKERARIGAMIGGGNKLAILSVAEHLAKPKGYLVNADRGEWVRGAWFSNGDHQSNWSRGRYLGSTTGKGTGWASHAYGKGVKRTGSVITEDSSMFRGRGVYSATDECPWCYSVGHVDLASNCCDWCDTCLDCIEPIRDCMCYGAEAQKHAEDVADAQAEYDAEHGRLDPATGDVVYVDQNGSLEPVEDTGKALVPYAGERWVGGKWVAS